MRLWAKIKKAVEIKMKDTLPHCWVCIKNEYLSTCLISNIQKFLFFSVEKKFVEKVFVLCQELRLFLHCVAGRTVSLHSSNCSHSHAKKAND